MLAVETQFLSLEASMSALIYWGLKVRDVGQLDFSFVSCDELDYDGDYDGTTEPESALTQLGEAKVAKEELLFLW